MQFQKWDGLDWDFSDYSSSHYPLEMSSLHWYPAAFIPQIPSIFIQELSKAGDIVLDPFMGSGTTLIEAIRQKREFAGNDINPFACEIARAKIFALGNFWGEKADRILCSIKSKIEDSSYSNNVQLRILPETAEWFQEKTLQELVKIHSCIHEYQNIEEFLVLKFAFTAILSRCCAQRDHYTYITDGCRPSPEQLNRYIAASSMYLDQLRQIKDAVELFRTQYRRAYGSDLDVNTDQVNKQLTNCNSKDLISLEDNSVDLIVTSPPYLGMNDYVRSMRLCNLFFPNDLYLDSQLQEIGARWKRRKKNAYSEFTLDMQLVYGEMARVLKPGKYLCLVIGESQGKVNQNHSTILDAEAMLERLGFAKEYEATRNVKFRRIISKKTNTFEKIYVYRLR